MARKPRQGCMGSIQVKLIRMQAERSGSYLSQPHIIISSIVVFFGSKYHMQMYMNRSIVCLCLVILIVFCSFNVLYIVFNDYVAQGCLHIIFGDLVSLMWVGSLFVNTMSCKTKNLSLALITCHFFSEVRLLDLFLSSLLVNRRICITTYKKLKMGIGSG